MFLCYMQFPKSLVTIKFKYVDSIFGYYRDDAFFCKAYQRRRGILDIYKAKPKLNSIDHSQSTLYSIIFFISCDFT